MLKRDELVDHFIWYWRQLNTDFITENVALVIAFTPAATI